MSGPSSGLEIWFEQQAARERRTVRLEDALLGGRFVAYFAYRLRFFALRYDVGSAVQLVKILLLHRLLGSPGLVAVVGLMAVAGLAAGAWWGALEVLRSRVRLLARFESPRAVSREVARWVLRGARLGLALAAFALGWLVVRAALEDRVTAVDVAVAAVLIRAGVDLPVRAYHAGAFALRRVYRPWTWILVLETLGLGAIVLLVPAVGAYAYGIAELFLAAAFAAVSVRYASRTHRLLGLDPRSLLSPREALGLGQDLRRGLRRRRPPAWQARLAGTREVLAPAAAGLLMSLDSLVLLAAFAAATAAGEVWLGLVFAAVAPTIRAGFDWSQLMYFDLKRLEAPLFINLRGRFERATAELAIVLGLAFGAVALAVGYGVLGVRSPWLLAAVPMLVGASRLSALQMRAFTDGAFGTAGLGGLVLLAGLMAATPLAARGVEPMLVLPVAVVLAAAAVAIAIRRIAAGGGDAQPRLPTAWLSSLASEPGPVALGMLRVRAGDAGRANGTFADPAELRTWRAIQIAQRLATRLGREGAVTVIDAERVAWFSRQGVTPPRGARVPRGPGIDGRAAVVASAGRISDLAETRAANGATALQHLAGWHVFKAEGNGPAGSTAELVARFRSLVPGGLAWAPSDRTSDGLATLGPTDRRLVLAEAVRHARTLSTRPGREALDVTCWCPAGGVELIFVAPRQAGVRALTRWRRVIRAANLATASGGELAAAPSRAGDILPVSARGASPQALAASAATVFRQG